MYVFRTEALGHPHIFSFEMNKAANFNIHDYASGDYSGASEGKVTQQFVKDNDKAKIDLIKSEFILEFMADAINLLHLSLLFFVRGFNLSIFNHFFLGQHFYQYFIKIKRDIAKQV